MEKQFKILLDNFKYCLRYFKYWQRLTIWFSYECLKITSKVHYKSGKRFYYLFYKLLNKQQYVLLDFINEGFSSDTGLDYFPMYWF